MSDLLIELFSEEIPARMQSKAAADLQKLVTDGLVEAGLTYASARAFSTPRRLTLALADLPDRSPDTREERKGPRVGAPEKALEGFLRGAGITADQLEERDDKKGATYYAIIEKAGRPAADIVADVLEKTIRNFPWPKSMRWGTGSLRWVRPLQSILCILTREDGADIVPLDVDGIVSGNETRGHRFMAPDAFTVSNFDDYATKLTRAHVMLDATDRADHIWADATNQAFANGLEVVEDKGLLAEVAGLVEHPVVLMGAIDDEFLGLPAEVLQTSMKEHQKFFSVRNPKTDRIEQFVTVANVKTADNGATILAGNQKVLSARLADAKFFWENDLRTAKSGMEAWTDALSNVTFHNKLGMQSERIARIADLASELAPAVGADPAKAREAALIAKADLSSEMVYEFPELQGLMGRYYAAAAGRDADVAAACEEHYSPLGPSDDVPTAPVSVAVALADKIDLLTGFWAIDEKPTGSKDPFALRRAALGVIRLIIENNQSLPLRKIIRGVFDLREAENAKAKQAEQRILEEKTADELGISVDQLRLLKQQMKDGEIDLSLPKEDKETQTSDQKNHWETFTDWVDVFQKVGQNLSESIAAVSNSLGAFIENSKWSQYFSRNVVADDLFAFLQDRLKVYLKDRGISHDVIDACLAMDGNDDLTLVVKRATALSDALQTEDGKNLIQGFKRANNILTQAEEKDGVEYSFGADIKHANDPAEVALFKALDLADETIKPALAAEDFSTAMSAMASLRAPIDAFFEAVQVNADTEIVRRNRLNLLHRIRATCGAVADLTKIEG